MRTWLLTGTMATLTACGGDVVVDVGGAGGTATTVTSTSTGAPTGCSGSGSACTDSCNDAITTGRAICASDVGTTAYATFSNLLECAASFCAEQCASICTSGLSSDCMTCVLGDCSMQVQDCQAN